MLCSEAGSLSAPPSPHPPAPKGLCGESRLGGQAGRRQQALWALEDVLSCHPYLSCQRLGLGVWLRLPKSLRVTLILGNVTVNFLVSVSGTEKIFVGKEKKKKQENAANADAFVSHDWDSGLVSTHSKQRKQKCERLFGSNFLNVFWEARVGHWSFKFE